MNPWEQPATAGGRPAGGDPTGSHREGRMTVRQWMGRAVLGLVISAFDYGPQHQSTCGLAFNEPVNGGPVFGPAWWKSDVFVAGYSRSKLYRTTLVKTPAGYVAQNNLLACLNM